MDTSTMKIPEIGQNSILEKFFVEEIKDIYDAGKQLQKNLIKLMDADVSPRLKKAFKDIKLVTIDQRQYSDQGKYNRHSPWLAKSLLLKEAVGEYRRTACCNS